MERRLEVVENKDDEIGDAEGLGMIGGKTAMITCSYYTI